MNPENTGQVRYHLVDFDQLPGVPCPCGISQRAWADLGDYPATLHRTEITTQAKPHYHQRLTETYYILDCEPGAQIELDGKTFPVKPGMCIVIRPGCVHRGLGRMKILNFVCPKFDPSDEFVLEG
ncbi:MAG: cupin domain-containing protein [Thermoguttaceae bacterium]|nr:cupin domain-containing protein [Thermoguttaceae bacterium]MDW8038319.1 cupin domain-containing protein [Thermoguttaceae bacterium]